MDGQHLLQRALRTALGQHRRAQCGHLLRGDALVDLGVVDHPVVLLVRGVGEVAAKHLVQPDEKLEQAGFGEGLVHVLTAKVDLGQQLHGLALLVRRVGLAQVPVGQAADFAVGQARGHAPLDPQAVGGDFGAGLDVLQQLLQGDVPLVGLLPGRRGGLDRHVLFDDVAAVLNKFNAQCIQYIRMEQLIPVRQTQIPQGGQLGKQRAVPKVRPPQIQRSQRFTAGQKGVVLVPKAMRKPKGVQLGQLPQQVEIASLNFQPVPDPVAVPP